MTNHYWADIITNPHTENKSTLVGYWQDIAGYYLDSITGQVWCIQRLGTSSLCADNYEQFKQKIQTNLRGKLI